MESTHTPMNSDEQRADRRARINAARVAALTGTQRAEFDELKSLGLSDEAAWNVASQRHDHQEGRAS